MRCPTCIKNAATHKVFDNGSSTTMLGGTFKHWDEKDREHHHYPNTITDHYSCSNGHRFSRKYRRGCPQSVCDSGEDRSVEITTITTTTEKT